MSMNNTPMGERLHIGIFGKRNAGKSSFINAITGQKLSIVSEVLGTTTDPVKKAMELLPLGPVVFIDTPGLDDEGSLGAERIKKARQMMAQTDFAILVISVEDKDLSLEQQWMKDFKTKKIPFLVVVNKIDQIEFHQEIKQKEYETILDISKEQIFFVSAARGDGILELKNYLPKCIPEEKEGKLISDLLEVNDLVVLVVPIDSAAPKGRLILPQQQVIRDGLEAGAICIVTRETELEETIARCSNIKMVVTDSQAFEYVAKVVPKDIPLTSFSMLMSKYKGDFVTQIEGVKAIDQLKANDKILICEGCTHHRQCDDIGTVKLPRWLKEYTKKELEFHFTSGTEFPLDLREYQLVIHCGGCTLNQREMQSRIAIGKEQKIPITNYGIAIAYMKGILDRVAEPILANID